MQRDVGFCPKDTPCSNRRPRLPAAPALSSCVLLVFTQGNQGATKGVPRHTTLRYHVFLPTSGSTAGSLSCHVFETVPTNVVPLCASSTGSNRKREVFPPGRLSVLHGPRISRLTDSIIPSSPQSTNPMPIPPTPATIAVGPTSPPWVDPPPPHFSITQVQGLYTNDPPPPSHKPLFTRSPTCWP